MRWEVESALAYAATDFRPLRCGGPRVSESFHVAKVATVPVADGDRGKRASAGRGGCIIL